MMEESTKEKILNGTASGERCLVEFMTLHPVERETSVKVKVTRAIKPVKTSSEKLTLNCEWDNCTTVVNKMEEFLRHVGQHAVDEGEKTYTCSWRSCKSVLKNRPTFLKHLYFHAFHTKLKCLGSNMLRDINLEGCKLDACFRNTVPELPDVIRCCWEDCEYHYNNPQALYWHVEAHVMNLPDAQHFTCMWTGCEVSLHKRYRLKVHMRTHTQEKIIACPNCGGFFANRTKFYDHCKRQVEPADASKQCSHCHKSFSTDRLLRLHMRRHINYYKCPLCQMTTPFPSSLREHIKYRHSDVKAFKCEFCTYTAKSSSDLSKHICTHYEGNQFQCKVQDCSFSCRADKTMKTHLQKVHKLCKSRQYRCHICEHVYPVGTSLTHHLMKVHGFHWPSGHKRFRYKLESNGFYQLQTLRYESLELTQELMNEEDEPEERLDLPINIEQMDSEGLTLTITHEPRHSMKDNVKP